MAKELVPIILSTAVWGPQLYRSQVCYHCDNSSVVAALSKGSTHDVVVIQLLHCLCGFLLYIMTYILFVNILKVLRMLSQITYLTITFHLFLLLPTGLINSHTTPTSHAEDCGHSWSRLDISALYKAVQFYYKHSLALSTRELYTYGILPYLQFCNLINQPPLPTSEQTLLLFTTHLALQHLTTSTIQTCFSVVHYLHLSSNHLMAYTTQLTPRVQQVLHGIKRHQASPHRYYQ